MDVGLGPDSAPRSGDGGHHGVRRPSRGLELCGHLAGAGRPWGFGDGARAIRCCASSRTALRLLDRRWTRSSAGLSRRFPSQLRLRWPAEARELLQRSAPSIHRVPAYARSRRHLRRQAGVPPRPAALLGEPDSSPGRRPVQGRDHGHRGLGTGSSSLWTPGQAIGGVGLRFGSVSEGRTSRRRPC